MLQVFEKDREGVVLRIERSSIHDGDGFRTVVFLKGCPLRCQWCSTPESQLMQPEQSDTYSYGTVMTVEDVLKETRKDSLFFFLSTGGVTLSGGEILAQPDFSYALLYNLKKECMNTAVETSFFGKWEDIERMLPYSNTAFVDFKIFDEEKHKKYCGVSNELIKSNLLATNNVDSRFRLVIRTPIVPGINDDVEGLRKMGEFCSQLNHLSHVQLLPYHRLGTATYDKLGRDYLLKGVEPPDPEEMEDCREVVREYVKTVI